jgi:hypothetical protein
VREKVLYILFTIAVLLFVAKPFIGFAALAGKKEHISRQSILIKSFDKRKPEDLHDAETQKAAVRALLLNPPLLPLSAIAFLLGFVFPYLFKPTGRISNSFLNSLHYKLIPETQTYLLNGKLTI